MTRERRAQFFAFGAIALAAVIGLTVVACDGGGGPTAPKAPPAGATSAAAPGAAGQRGEAPELPAGGLDGEPAAPGDEPGLADLGEPMLETVDAKGGQPKQELCHWDKDAAAYVLITVGQPGFDNHLAKHSMDKALPTWWFDADGDGFGDAGISTQACDQPAGYVDNPDDCQDDASSCTTDCSQDDDSDGVPSCRDQCWDADGDSYGYDASGDIIGGGAVAVGSCTTDGAAACDVGPACLGDDCNDSDPAINPAASDDDCDGVDENCSGTADEGYVSSPTSCGVGECAASGTLSCVAGTEVDDCTPGPSNPETCDGLDNDCDGDVDNGGVCGGKVVFVSSGVYDGNFGNGQRVEGHLEADQECQSLANAAGLSGTFLAWMSGRLDGFGCGGGICMGQNVADRFTPSAGPYTLWDGTKVADDWSDLTDGSLDHPIDMDELGNPLSGTNRVWTNTTTGGMAWELTTNCATGPGTDPPGGFGTWSCGAPSWTPGDCQFQSGKFGDATSTSGSWTGTDSSNHACTNENHIYCFEQ
jgi:hypothetical protein